jgi:hypothetical protein
MVRRIVSGGQTGADRGGLDAAIEMGIPHGGWCPKGRKAEDGMIPLHYDLVETDSGVSEVRTERNVIDSDGTVLFTFGEPTGGSALTADFAHQYGRPLLHLDLSAMASGEAATRLRAWLHFADIEVLNVAGSRESKTPGLEDTVKVIITLAIG